MKNNFEESIYGKWSCLIEEDGIPVEKILVINEKFYRLTKSKGGENTEDKYPSDWHFFGNELECMSSDKYYICFADSKKLVFGERNGHVVLWQNEFLRMES